MSDSTAIQWTDSTWNIVTGCTRVSPGCARCYIERTPPFRMQHRKFETIAGEATTGVTLHWDRLDKIPRGPKVFTPSLGDLFHEQVPFDFIDGAFARMAYRPDRIFQVLTKRPERLRAYYASFIERELSFAWPLPNVWLGVSIENARFTWRADVLREIPAAIRFISAEPLLGSLFAPHSEPMVNPRDPSIMGLTKRRAPLDLIGIDWIIIGGESGPKARPFHLEHAREILEEVYSFRAHEWRGMGPPAIFVKQLGAKPIEQSLAAHIEYQREEHRPLRLDDRKGGDIQEWPADLRMREFPRSAA